ncbi:sensor histidine kinase [Wenjunlia tyrosinilytica]|uniref:histidine kinase n=1 Tax=Wenjunlia tyrosinilytica TaxID=1544741 RepID=A0A917ZTW1_9ACTN|nr:sensor histidine kinase [Wenjunlia tyrosinilytica]GGO91344.1 histidine kinase [Wenjunlia tyrosinilytica]
MRLRWPTRVFSQVLVVQLAITTGVIMLAAGLFLAPLSSQLDKQAMARAKAIAQTTAVEPGIARDLLSSRPTPDGPVQAAAERIRLATGASYVVVMDIHGIRYSHTTLAEIGRHVSTDPGEALAGHEWTGIDEGTLGRSARGKVPLHDSEGAIVGAVSVGIAYDSVRDVLLHAIPGILMYAGAALGVGAVAAFAVSRRLRRSTHGIELSEISALLDEREAMLHSIREGVVALDRRGRVRLVNDEAQRLLGVSGDMAGRPLAEVVPPGRTADVLEGRVEGKDLLTVCGGRVLVTNRMPTADGGAVATLRDRTELEHLGRELDSTRGLTEALRAQDHEHANRLHTLVGLLELGMHEEAVEFIAEVAHAHRATAEEVTERVHDPLVAALLVGKGAIAAERGVALRVSEATLLPDRVVDARDLVTVVGNLLDNALDAAGTGTCREPFVEVELRADGSTVVLKVSDSGPGVPVLARELVFTEGWSTKVPAAFPSVSRRPSPASSPDCSQDAPSAAVPEVARDAPVRSRGIGLSLVRRLAERYGGTARVSNGEGGGAVFTVVLPEALRDEPLRELEGAAR